MFINTNWLFAYKELWIYMLQKKSNGPLEFATTEFHQQ